MINRKTILLSLLSVAWAGPCLACYNDTAVEKGEQEFRSQYGVANAAEAKQDLPRNGWSIAASCTGLGLAAGSLVVAIGRQKRGTP